MSWAFRVDRVLSARAKEDELERLEHTLAPNPTHPEMLLHMSADADAERERENDESGRH